MASEYVLYRVRQVERGLQVLRETFERRFREDEAVDNAIVNVELEVTLLKTQLKKEQ